MSYEGQCSKGKLSFCDNGDLVSVDCKAKGQVCGFDIFNFYFDCLLAPFNKVVYQKGLALHEGGPFFSWASPTAT